MISARCAHLCFIEVIFCAQPGVIFQEILRSELAKTGLAFNRSSGLP
jgi:hypothetical protein